MATIRRGCKLHQKTTLAGEFKVAASSKRPVKAGRTPDLIPTEAEEQKVLAKWLDLRFGKRGWVHVPNEQMGGPQRIGKLRAMGLKQGFPDILIFKEAYESTRVNGVPCIVRILGMAIELKRVKGARWNPGQKEYLKYFDSIGWATAVSYGAQDAINKIEEVYGR